jgi:DNA-binding MarR family transcriptional regulator
MMQSIPPAAFYSPQNLKHDQSVGFLIKRVMQSILLQADRRLAEHGLTHAQWVPLFSLYKRECATVAALARDLQTDPGAMTRSLDRLEAKGLVERTRSVEDRRVVDLQLTDDGRRLAALVPEVLCEVLNLHLSGFSHEEWQTLLGLLTRLALNGDALRELDKAVEKTAE